MASPSKAVNMDSGMALRDMELSYKCDGLFAIAKDQKFSQMKTKNIAIRQVNNSFSIFVSSKARGSANPRRIQFSEITAYKLRSDAGLATPLLRLSTCREEYMIKFDVDRDRANWMAHMAVAFAVVKKNFEWTSYFLYMIYSADAGYREPFLLRLLPEENPIELVVENPITHEESQRFYLQQLLTYKDSAACIVHLTYANGRRAKSHECSKNTLEFKCSWSRSLVAVLTKRLGKLGLQFRSDGATEFRRVFSERPDPVVSSGSSAPSFQRRHSSSGLLSPNSVTAGDVADPNRRSQTSETSPLPPQQQQQQQQQTRETSPLLPQQQQTSDTSPLLPQQHWSEARPVQDYGPHINFGIAQQHRPDTLVAQQVYSEVNNSGQASAPPPLPPTPNDSDGPSDLACDFPPPPDFISSPSPLQTPSPGSSSDVTPASEKSKQFTLPRRLVRTAPSGDGNDEYVPLSPTQPRGYYMGKPNPSPNRIDSSSSAGSDGAERTPSPPPRCKVPHNTPVSSLPKGTTAQDMRLYMNVPYLEGLEEQSPPEAPPRQPRPFRRQLSTDAASRGDTIADTQSEAKQIQSPAEAKPPKATPRTLDRNRLPDRAARLSAGRSQSAEFDGGGGVLEWLKSEHPTEAAGSQAEVSNQQGGALVLAIARRYSSGSGVLNWMETEHPGTGESLEENIYSQIDSFEDEKRPEPEHVRKTGPRFERANGSAAASTMGYFDSFDSDPEDANTQSPDGGSVRFDSLCIRNVEDEGDDDIGSTLSGDLSGAVVPTNFFQRCSAEELEPSTAVGFLNPSEADGGGEEDEPESVSVTEVA